MLQVFFIDKFYLCMAKNIYKTIYKRCICQIACKHRVRNRTIRLSTLVYVAYTFSTTRNIYFLLLISFKRQESETNIISIDIVDRSKEPINNQVHITFKYRSLIVYQNVFTN